MPSEARWYVTHRRSSWSELRTVPKAVVAMLSVDAALHAIVIVGWHRPDMPLSTALLVAFGILALPVAFLEFALRLYGTELHYGERP